MPENSQTTLICAHCGEKTARRVDWKRFCSQECRAAYHAWVRQEGRRLFREAQEGLPHAEVVE